MVSKRMVGLALVITALLATSAFAITNVVNLDINTLAGVGTLDITNNKGVVRSTTLADVTAKINSGFNFGLWNGTGINSSTAAARATTDGLTGIGYVSNDMLGFTTDFWGATFPKGNLAAVATEVLVEYTWYGDTDLDRVVTDADLGAMFISYDAGGAGTIPGFTWLDGDTDHDTFITDADLGVAFLAYDASNGAGAPLSGGGITAVPEPATMTLVFFALCGLGIFKLLKK